MLITIEDVDLEIKSEDEANVINLAEILIKNGQSFSVLKKDYTDIDAWEIIVCNKKGFAK